MPPRHLQPAKAISQLVATIEKANRQLKEAARRLRLDAEVADVGVLVGAGAGVAAVGVAIAGGEGAGILALAGSDESCCDVAPAVGAARAAAEAGGAATVQGAGIVPNHRVAAVGPSIAAAARYASRARATARAHPLIIFKILSVDFFGTFSLKHVQSCEGLVI